MKFQIKVLLVGVVIWFMLIRLAYADTEIIIVRHGEKPALGLGQLSCQGLNRSLALPHVLFSRFGKPVAIYAPNPAMKKFDKGVPYAYVRPLSTIEPYAIRLGLPINIEEILLARTDGTQIVAWEHHFAVKVAQELLAKFGGNPGDVPDWNDEDFDSIYIVKVTGIGKDRHTSFVHENEGLNDLSGECSL